MKFIDLHCDTISKMMADTNKYELKKNDFHVDLEKLKKGDCLAQTFALYVDISEIKNPYEYCMKMADKFHEEMSKNIDLIKFASNYDQIMQNQNDGLMTALLSIEEGAVLEGNIDNLQRFYDRGVRMITLSWNHENELSFPHNKEEFREKGLKDFGIEVVHKMNDLGMIIDVSHISDKGFYDVAKLSNKPFIATHSNARQITGHSRNLTDDMLKIIADKGGVTGINFFHSFLSNTLGIESKIEYMVEHIKHIYNVAGIDAIAIGSDFDGIESDVDIKDASEMGKLYTPLKKAGFTEEEIEKIYYKNALRVIKDVL